jgi:hypothetical protein
MIRRGIETRETPTQQLSDFVYRMAIQFPDAKRVALAAIKIGDLLIRGFSVWELPDGTLSVFFPSYRLADGVRQEFLGVPAELRVEIEAAIISEYQFLDDHNDLDRFGEILVRL